MLTDTVTYPYPFVKGFMGFDTELEFMRDFTATMRDSGIKKYATTYAEFVERANRSVGRVEPKSFVPTVVKPSEGGDIPTGGNGNGATYEGPKDLDYNGKKFGKVPGTRSGRGIVHGMSPAQKRFVLSLLSTKDTTELSTKLLRGWTLNPTEVDSISKQHARPFIDALLSCPNKSVTAVKGDSVSGKKELNGSPRQIEWLTAGINGKPSLLSEKGFTSESDISNLYIKHNYSAKSIIDALLKMKVSEVVKAEVTKAQEDEEYVPTKIIPGFYRDEDGTEWKVQFNKSETGMYALRKVTPKRYEFVSGAIRDLTPEMFVSLNPLTITLDEAKAYGRKTGSCYMCGRVLTKQSSIDEGIGPICAGKF